MQRATFLLVLVFCVFPSLSAGEPEPAHDLNGAQPLPAAGIPENSAVAIPADAAPRKPFEVRLYGLADLDITHSKDSKGIAITTIGIWTGSRLGLKGSADLGDGLKSTWPTARRGMPTACVANSSLACIASSTHRYLGISLVAEGASRPAHGWAHGADQSSINP